MDCRGGGGLERFGGLWGGGGDWRGFTLHMQSLVST